MTVSSNSRNDGILPPIVKSAIKAGSFTGFGGLVIGGVYGSVYSSTPFLFSIAYGLQCFAIGGVYWGSRGLMIQKIGGQSSKEKLYASAAAGGITGGLMSLLTRRRGSFVPGVIVLAAVGASSQGVFDMMDLRHSKAQEAGGNVASENVLQKLAASRWSPFKVLTDDEYADIVRERILRLDAEITVTEEDMNRTRKSGVDTINKNK